MHDNDDNDDPSNLGSKSWQEKHSIISATLTESIESNTSSIVVYIMVESVMEFWVISIKFTETCKYGHLCQPIFLVFRYERQTGAIWTTIIWNVNNLTRKTFPHFRHNDRIDQKILKVKQSCNASFKQTTLPKNKKNPPIDSCHSKMHTADCF